MVLDVKIDQVIAEKIKAKHQSVFFETPGISPLIPLFDISLIIVLNNKDLHLILISVKPKPPLDLFLKFNILTGLSFSPTYTNFNIILFHPNVFSYFKCLSYVIHLC